MEEEEFKPDEDLKPDASDRRPTRTRKARPSAPKLAVSRQHMMMGIGILVLLVLIIGIGSALKSPSKGEAGQQASKGGTKDISLSGSSSLSNNTASNTTDAHDGSGVNNSGMIDHSADAGKAPAAQPQDVSVPPISNTPTQAAPVQGEQGQQRIDLAGNNMSDALTQQQGQVDSAVQGIDGGANASTLPTAPATLGSGAAVSKPATNNGTAQNIRPIQTKPASTANSNVTKPHSGKTTVSKTPTHTANAAKPTNTKTPATTTSKPATHAVSSAVSGANASLKGAPSNHYTLQLSSASRSDSLNAYAKKQNLAHYWVYETTRNGKPWYVLVSGSYSSSAEAKRAVSTLPADVQAKNPWVRPMSQVQKDVKK